MKILVIDREKAIRDLLPNFAEMHGHSAECPENLDEAIELARIKKFDLIIIRLNFRNRLDGINIMGQIKLENQKNDETEFWFISGSLPRTSGEVTEKKELVKFMQVTSLLEEIPKLKQAV